jgi:hypothetical protein
MKEHRKKTQVSERSTAIGTRLRKRRRSLSREGEENTSVLASVEEALAAEGQPLDPRLRRSVEARFKHNLADVRVHTDAKAAQTASGLQARAFTVGRDIGFAAGEYRPGTLVGDAIIAHELAHVVQQKGATAAGATTEHLVTSDTRLEQDADRSALGVLGSLWGGVYDMLCGISSTAAPRLRTGLRLSRCSGTRTPCTGYSVTFRRGPLSKYLEVSGSAAGASSLELYRYAGKRGTCVEAAVESHVPFWVIPVTGGCLVKALDASGKTIRVFCETVGL